jgi:hypothetical protein
MLIQNTTLYIEESILLDCMTRLKSDYLPDLHSNKNFENVVFTEVLSNNEPNMRTYSIQVFCSGLSEMKVWKDDFQPKLESISGSFSGKVLFFHSKMRVID